MSDMRHVGMVINVPRTCWYIGNVVFVTFSRVISLMLRYQKCAIKSPILTLRKIQDDGYAENENLNHTITSTLLQSTEQLVKKLTALLSHWYLRCEVGND